MQIQKLERELGVEIFDRSTHPITITKIGEKIINQAKMVLLESKKLQQLVDEERNAMSGNFEIGIIPTVLPTLVPLFFKTFQKNHPSINLRIKEQKTSDIITNLKNGNLDFGILVTPLENPEIIEIPLYYEPILGYVPKGHRLYGKKKLDESELDTADMILMEEGHCFRNNILSICKSIDVEDRKVQLESGNFNTLLKLAKDGYGMTMIPGLQVEDLSKEDQGLVKHFNDPQPTREVSLVYHNSQLRISFAEEIVKLIRGILRGKIFLESSNATSPLFKVAK